MKRSSGYQKNGRYSGLFSYMEVKVRLMRYLLGIDNGGTFSKAAVFDEDGKQISVASVPTVTLTPKPGYTEKDLDELWEVNAQAVRTAIEKSGIDPKDIAGVSFSGAGKGLYLIGSGGIWGCHGKA